jgi:hypothetical protein
MNADMFSQVWLPPNMRMHLQKPRAPWSKAGRRRHASFQVIRGR